MSNHQNPTIVILDSGIGGVAVLKQLISKYMAGNYIYYADNKYMPYGNKNRKWLKSRIVGLIAKLKQEFNPEYIIVACNTASTVINDFQLKNVITMNFDDKFPYLATKLTKRNMPNLSVIADSTLAKQIELNIFDSKKLNSIVYSHIKKHKLMNLPKFVLGCTHYELVKDLFKKHCKNSNVICNSSYLINSLNLDLNTNEINIVVITSKKDRALEAKIRALISV